MPFIPDMPVMPVIPVMPVMHVMPVMPACLYAYISSLFYSASIPLFLYILY